MPDLDQLLKARGTTAEFGAHVVAATFCAAGSHAGFGLGDGTIRLRDAQDWRSIAAHDGAVLSLAPHPVRGGFCSGGDDGRLLSVGLEGGIAEIAAFGLRWVEHVVSFAGKTPMIAAAVGKNLHLFTGAGEKTRILGASLHRDRHCI